MSKYTWCLEYGHGGKIKGKYQTEGKRSPNWDLGVYYEGVGNRDIVDTIYKVLNSLSVHVIIPYHSELDIPLKNRVNIIDELYKSYRNMILVSVHSNAFHKLNVGGGFMGITSVGQTYSDVVATYYYQEMQKLFPEDYFYMDNTDGDIDWEIDLALTRDTDCPAILTENRFMTTYSDYKKLMDPDERKKIALGHINMILAMEKRDTLTFGEMIDILNNKNHAV